jgi:hypothetical protein
VPVCLPATGGHAGWPAGRTSVGFPAGGLGGAGAQVEGVVVCLPGIDGHGGAPFGSMTLSGTGLVDCMTRFGRHIAPGPAGLAGDDGHGTAPDARVGVCEIEGDTAAPGVAVSTPAVPKSHDAIRKIADTLDKW